MVVLVVGKELGMREKVTKLELTLNVQQESAGKCGKWLRCF